MLKGETSSRVHCRIYHNNQYSETTYPKGKKSSLSPWQNTVQPLKKEILSFLAMLEVMLRKLNKVENIKAISYTTHKESRTFKLTQVVVEPLLLSAKVISVCNISPFCFNYNFYSLKVVCMLLFNWCC